MKRSTWKTAPPQYDPGAEGLLEQNDPPTKRCRKNAEETQHKFDLNPGPGKGKGQCPKKMEKLTPIIVADLAEDKETDPTIFVSLDEDRQKDQEEEHTREEEPCQSPPEEEKGNLPYAYTPKSPPYPPPEDDDWETESLPRLVTPDADQDTVIVPADQDADKDFFQDSKRQSAVQQKYESEIQQAPLNPQADSDNPLMKLGDMIPKATPVYEGFWKNSDLDILSRLDCGLRRTKRQMK